MRHPPETLEQTTKHVWGRPFEGWHSRAGSLLSCSTHLKQQFLALSASASSDGAGWQCPLVLSSHLDLPRQLVCRLSRLLAAFLLVLLLVCLFRALQCLHQRRWVSCPPMQLAGHQSQMVSLPTHSKRDCRGCCCLRTRD